MVDISQSSDIQSNEVFSAVAGLACALKNFDKVFISEGAANSRIRKIETLNAKPDKELATMGLNRDDIIKVVFSDYADIKANQIRSAFRRYLDLRL